MLLSRSLVSLELIADIFSIIFTIGIYVIFVMSASIFTAFNHSVDELQLVTWIAIWEICLDLLVQEEHVLNSLRCHSYSTQDVFARNKLTLYFASFVEDEGRTISVLEILNGLCCNAFYELYIFVFSCKLVEGLVQKLAFNHTKIKGSWLGIHFCRIIEVRVRTLEFWKGK